MFKTKYTVLKPVQTDRLPGNSGRAAADSTGGGEHADDNSFHWSLYTEAVSNK